MHRTDPLYVAIVIVFTLVLLTILLRRLRASMPGDRNPADNSHPAKSHVSPARPEAGSRNSRRDDD